MKKIRKTAWVIKDAEGRLLLDSFGETQIQSARKAHRSGKDWRVMLSEGCSCIRVEIREL